MSFVVRPDRMLLRVPALGPAVRFYQGLGLKLLRQDNRLAAMAFAEGPTELILHTDPDLPAEAVYYLVNDVRELYQQRQELQLQFVQPPQPASRGYRAAVKDPFGNVLLLIDRSADAADGGAAIEDAKPPTALFPGVERQVAPRREALIKLYETVGRTADDLPYTPHFEKLYNEYSAAIGSPPPTRQEVWRHLLNLRKGGKLPRLGAARSEAPPIDAPAAQRLRELVGKDIGKRDRLPYTPRFDQIVDEFNQTQPRALSPHLVWRLVANLAK